MKRDYDKFYNKEQPRFMVIKSGELRLYNVSQRLAVSKPQWVDKEGRCQMGKTVSIDLAANKGDQELIDFFECVVELLKSGELNE